MSMGKVSGDDIDLWLALMCLHVATGLQEAPFRHHCDATVTLHKTPIYILHMCHQLVRKDCT
jgi:hypothetical protein